MAIETYQAQQFLIDASIDGGCKCRSCREERMIKATLSAYQMIIPDLKSVPMVLSVEYSHRLPDYWLDYIRDLGAKRIIRKEFEQNKESPKPLYQCNWCGNLHVASDGRKLSDGNRYCTSCQQLIAVCTDCGVLRKSAEVYQIMIHGGSSSYVAICRDCRQKYRKCIVCMNLFQPKDVIALIQRRSEQPTSQSYKYICHDCAKNTKEACSKCGNTIYPGFWTVRGDQRFCLVCEEESKGVCAHNYKPLMPRFRKDKKEGKVTSRAFHMGFELEVSDYNSLIPVESVVQLVKELVGRKNVYAMGDGSISQATNGNSSGAEFASHPFTWQYYKKRGYHHWDTLCLALRKYGWRADLLGLGIHIHTTKAAWGTHQIFKLLQFVKVSTSKVQWVAQRGQTIYNNYDYMDNNSNMVVAKEKKQNGGHGHYRCINLNQGETGQAAKTIEFRMFQATLEPLYFHKNIEFVYSLWQFTQQYSLKQMNWSAYLIFLKKNRREYPCLTEFITKEMN